MKIGILTFHYAYNYGAILQAYATQHLLESMGHMVEFINYQNSDIVWNYQRLHFKWNMNVIKQPRLSIINFFRTKQQVVKEKKYDEFIKQKLNVAPTLYKKGDTIDVTDYNAVLIGSDQVWNPNLTGGLDEVYWGKLRKGENTKIIAWAPSSLNLDYTEEELSKMQKYLDNFSSLSVRDESLKIIVEKLIPQKVSITIDPTFLLEKNEWIKLCHKVPEKNYVLVYAVRHYDQTYKFAKLIAKKYNKKLVVLRSRVNPLKHSYDKNTCSPEDFLSYIYYADYVVASSFHGTAFSIIFEKKFINFVPESSKDSRVLTILKALDLGERVVNERDSYEIVNKIPTFQKAREKLKNQKETSISYLLSSL